MQCNDKVLDGDLAICQKLSKRIYLLTHQLPYLKCILRKILAIHTVMNNIFVYCNVMKIGGIKEIGKQPHYLKKENRFFF